MDTQRRPDDPDAIRRMVSEGYAQVVEQRSQPLHGGGLASDHQAVALGPPPDAAAGANINILDVPGG